MKKINSENGITIVALVITVIVLLLINATAFNISTKQFEKTELQGFYLKLEIAQNGVEKIVRTNETYVDENGNTAYLKDTGGILTASQEKIVTDLGYESENFKYFTAAQVQEELGINGVDLDLLIDFNNCIVISAQPKEINGKKYYMLKDNKYRVTTPSQKNVGDVNFTYVVNKYGTDSYKIVITPQNIGDIQEGVVKYKESDVATWNTAQNNEFIVSELKSYDIMYVDSNNNSKQKQISISLDSDNNIVTNEIDITNE